MKEKYVVIFPKLWRENKENDITAYIIKQKDLGTQENVKDSHNLYSQQDLQTVTLELLSREMNAIIAECSNTRIYSPESIQINMTKRGFVKFLYYKEIKKKEEKFITKKLKPWWKRYFQKNSA